MLPEPAARRPIHSRRLEMHGYQREDGLWDIEGRLVDTKAYPFDNRFRGEIPPGEPVHEMWLRLTLDDDLVIREAVASTEHSPFPSCPAAAPRYERLVGLQIGPGWLARVKKRLPAVEGCTHISELLRTMATTAFQTIAPLRREKIRQPGPSGRPALLDSCHGWRSGGEFVREVFPDWYSGGED